MTKITVLSTAFYVLAVASGCSSSSSPAGASPDASSGSNSNEDSSSPEGDGAPGDDSSNPLAPPAAGKCPGVPCGTGESCCFNPLSNTGLCQSASTSCGGAMLTLGCSAPADCDKMAGTGCCLKGSYGSGPVKVAASCADPSTCVTSGVPMTFVVLFCDSTHACPSGLNCVPSPYGQGEYCVSPDAGTGTPEAGAGSDAAAATDGPSE